jgi:septal ring factor EnvC (AmiA/AmiB activator)
MQLPAIGKTITPESHVPQQKVSYPGAKLTESDLRAIGLYRQLAKDRDERIAELEAKTKALRAVQNDIARVIEKATPEALAKLFK